MSLRQQLMIFIDCTILDSLILQTNNFVLTKKVIFLKERLLLFNSSLLMHWSITM